MNTYVHCTGILTMYWFLPAEPQGNLYFSMEKFHFGYKHSFMHQRLGTLHFLLSFFFPNDFFSFSNGDIWLYWRRLVGRREKQKIMSLNSLMKVLKQTVFFFLFEIVYVWLCCQICLFIRPDISIESRCFCYFFES